MEKDRIMQQNPSILKHGTKNMSTRIHGLYTSALEYGQYPSAPEQGNTHVQQKTCVCGQHFITPHTQSSPNSFIGIQLEKLLDLPKFESSYLELVTYCYEELPEKMRHWN